MQQLALDVFAPQQIRSIVTSRPEGIPEGRVLDRFKTSRFHVLDLDKLKNEQVRRAIEQQTLKDSSAEFFQKLYGFQAVRDGHEDIYKDIFNDEQRNAMETLPCTDRLYDESDNRVADMRQMNLNGTVVRRLSNASTPNSSRFKVLCGPGGEWSTEALAEMDDKFSRKKKMGGDSKLSKDLFDLTKKLAKKAKSREKELRKLQQQVVKHTREVSSAGLGTLDHEKAKASLAICESKIRMLLSEKASTAGLETPSLVARAIVQDTDEIYAAAESCATFMKPVLIKLLDDVAAPGDYQLAGTKDPVRVFEKGLDDYNDERHSFPDKAEPPAACVLDLHRSRGFIKSAEAAKALLVKLDAPSGWEFEIEVNGAKRKATVLLARNKNKFDPRKVDPTRYRNVLLNLAVTIEGFPRQFFELQLHHRAIFDHNEKVYDENHPTKEKWNAHIVYNYFRARLGGSYGSELNQLLERAIAFMLDEVCKTPVLLSLLIVAARSGAGSNRPTGGLPASLYELYSLAIGNVANAIAAGFDDDVTVADVLRVLQLVSTENMRQGDRIKREFTATDVQVALGLKRRNVHFERDETSKFWQLKPGESHANLEPGVRYEQAMDIDSDGDIKLKLLGGSKTGYLKASKLEHPKDKMVVGNAVDVPGAETINFELWNRMFEVDDGNPLVKVVEDGTEDAIRAPWMTVGAAGVFKVRGKKRASLQKEENSSTEKPKSMAEKTLNKDLYQDGGAVYQFRHLSIQEALFSVELSYREDGRASEACTVAWGTDAEAANFLQIENYRNSIRIGGEPLGAAFAALRGSWDFSARENSLSQTGLDSLLHLIASSPGPGANGIDLARCSLTAVAEKLASALESNTSLQSLGLASTELHEDGVIAIGMALTANVYTAVSTLDLSQNTLSAKSHTALATLLEASKTLKVLRINECGIRWSDEHTRILFNALKTNSSLERLELNGSSIEKGGVYALTEAIKSETSTLKVLDISGNQLIDTVDDNLWRLQNGKTHSELVTGKMYTAAMDVDSDGDIKLYLTSGSKTSYIKVSEYLERALDNSKASLAEAVFSLLKAASESPKMMQVNLKHNALFEMKREDKLTSIDSTTLEILFEPQAPYGTNIMVTNAGTSRMNGFYRHDGSNSGKPQYRKIDMQGKTVSGAMQANIAWYVGSCSCCIPIVVCD